MDIFFWCLGILAALTLLAIIGAFICFLMVFYSPKKKPLGENEYDIPSGKAYQKHRDAMINWQKAVRSMPREKLEIISHDGLKLRGYYYEYEKGAPIEIQFHGYKGSGERDLSGGVGRCFAIGRSVIIVDQRGHGMSEGRVTTFGVKERYDCIRWAEYAVKRFGEDTKLILTGVSMGAATVILAAAEKPLPNVVCVLADCGYSSAEAIIKKVTKELHLPVSLLYPFVKLGARVFGGFDLDEASPLKAAAKLEVPLIMFHGDSDTFVPCEMSQEVFEACSSEKKQLTFIKGAEHGLAYPTDKEKYLYEMRKTIDEWKL